MNQTREVPECSEKTAMQLRKRQIRISIRTRGRGDHTHLSLRLLRGGSRQRERRRATVRRGFERALPLARSSKIWKKILEMAEKCEWWLRLLSWEKKSVKEWSSEHCYFACLLPFLFFSFFYIFLLLSSTKIRNFRV